MKKHIWLTFFMAIAAALLILPTDEAAAGPTLAYGNQSGDVWDLQFRLKILGYYNKELTGFYGPVTNNAVRRFQQNYGLRVDGITGPQTWRMLKKVSVNKKELDILAHIIHGEARGEPYEGQVAVGAVVMNRVKSPLFPNTVREVVFEPRAFTAVADGQYWLTPNRTAYRAAHDAVRGWDPSGGALYYFNPETATSKWIWSRKQIKKIGKHIFAV